MTLPILLAAQPLVIPERTFDKIWVEAISISAPSPDQDATAIVRLRRFQTVDGVSECEQESQKLEVNGILALAETDSDLAAAVGALMAYIAKIGVEQGVITRPTRTN